MISFGTYYENSQVQSIDNKHKIEPILVFQDQIIEGYCQQLILLSFKYRNNDYFGFVNILDMSLTQLILEFNQPVFLLKYMIYDQRFIIYANQQNQDAFLDKFKFIRTPLKQQKKIKEQYFTKCVETLQSLNKFTFLALTRNYIKMYSKNKLKTLRKFQIESDSVTCIRDQLIIRKYNYIKLYQISSLHRVRNYTYWGGERIFQEILNNKNQLFLRTYTLEEGQKLINTEDGTIKPLTIDQQFTNSQLWYFEDGVLNCTQIPDTNIKFQVNTDDSLSLKAFQEGHTTLITFLQNEQYHVFVFSEN